MAEKALALARVAGRIMSLRRVNAAAGATFRVVLKLPSADQYSSPDTIEVRSAERFGSIGDEVSIQVRLGGYARSYRSKDDPSAAPVQTAENVLQFVALA